MYQSQPYPFSNPCNLYSNLLTVSDELYFQMRLNDLAHLQNRYTEFEKTKGL